MADVQDLILEELRGIKDTLKELPCRDHAERIVRNEGKVKELNDVRQLIRSTVVRWGLPLLLGGLGIGATIVNALK